MHYRIISTDCKAFWSNADGWVGLYGSDIFTEKERETLNLPIDGCWVPAGYRPINTVEELAQFLDYLPQKMKVTVIRRSSFPLLDPPPMYAEITSLDGPELRDHRDVDSYGLAIVVLP